jgi:hypothetical protein
MLIVIYSLNLLVMKTIRRLLFVTAGICLMIACSKSDSYWNTDSPQGNVENSLMGLKSAMHFCVGDQFDLEGLALYRTWKVGNGEVLQDNGLPCEANLEILENHGIRFTFTEPPKPTIVCYGKMAESGTLNFTYPTPVAFGLNITDILRMHTCATIWGPGIEEGTLVFKGEFDGTTFLATASFMARIDVPCPDGMFGGPIEGNLHYTFGYDLTVK